MLEEDWPWRFETLSCGQQKRLQVACALWPSPDVLVLDEPTNHVDVSTKHALLRPCRSSRVSGCLFHMIGSCWTSSCTQCLFVADGTANMKSGNYSQASSQVELERSSALHAKEAAKRRLALSEKPSDVEKRLLEFRHVKKWKNY